MFLPKRQLVLIALLFSFRVCKGDLDDLSDAEVTTSLGDFSESVGSSDYEISVATEASSVNRSEYSSNTEPPLVGTRDERKIKLDNSSVLTIFSNSSLKPLPSPQSLSSTTVSLIPSLIKEIDHSPNPSEVTDNEKSVLPENSSESSHETAVKPEEKEDKNRDANREEKEKREDKSESESESEKNIDGEESDEHDLRNIMTKADLEPVLDKPTINDEGENFSFEDANLENFTLPSFEVDPIVDFFNNNDSYLNEQQTLSNTSKSTFQAPKGLGSGNLLHEIFTGPDRSKLPFNAPPEDIYKYLANAIDNETSVIGKEILPYIVELGYKVNVNSKCSKALLALSSGLKAKRTWAFKFLSSKGQMQSQGLLEGTVASLGNFDQCLAIRVEDEAILPEERFVGRYCLANIRPPLPKLRKRLTFKDQILNFEDTELQDSVWDHLGSFAHEYYSNPFVLGLCVPSPCSSHDVSKIMDQILSQFNFTVSFDSRCVPETKYWEAPSPPEYAIFLFCVVILMAILGTAYDAYIRKKEENCLGRLFASFSVISNTKNLFGRSEFSATEEKIACERRSLSWIHGLQVIALFWLIVANVYQLGGLPISFIIKNLHQDYRSKGGSILFQLVLNSWDYLAELFFLISGFIFANVYLNAHEKKKAPTFGRFIVRQWFKFAPSIIAVILITLIVFQTSWSSGPLFSKAEHLIVDQCNKNGITSIMLFSNWLPTKEMCLPHTWYISALFQLQLVGFVVVLLLHYKSSIGITISLILILLGMIVPGMITYLNDLPPTMLLNNPDINQVQADLELQYFSTYNHLSTYFIGILLGFFIHNKGLKPTINRGIRLAIWILLSAITLSSILITCKWNGFEEVPSRVSSTIYSSLHRIAFVSMFVWLIHQFTCGQKGPIEQLLSWNGFKVVNRLGMQIYLIHLIIIWHYFLTKRTAVEYRNFEIVTISLGIAFLSTLAAYVLYLFVEAPFLQVTSGFIKCLFGCDLKARLRELEEESRSQSGGPISVEKKDTVDGEIRINVVSPTEDDQGANNNGVVIRL